MNPIYELFIKLGTKEYMKRRMERAQTYFERAEGYMRRRRKIEALIDYAEVLCATGRDEKALSLLAEAIESEESGRVYERRAHLLRELGRYEEAISDLNQAIRLTPENAMVWYTRGITYRGLGKLEEAAEDLKSCIQLEDAHRAITTYYELGAIYYELRRFEEALEAFMRTASDQERALPAFYYFIARTLYQLDQSAEATQYAQRAIERLEEFQQMPDKGLAVATSLFYSYGAFKTFQEQIEESYGFRLLLANLYAESQNLDLALRALDEGLQNYPGASDLLLRRASLYREGQRYEEAQRDLDEAKERYPDLSAVYLERSTLYRDQGMEEQARAELKELMERHPDLPIPYYLLAESYLREEKLEEALSANQRLIELENDDPLNYIQQGEIFKAMKKAAAAEQAFTSAIALHDTPDFRMKRSFVYFVQQRYDEAWKDLEAISAMDPELEHAPYYQKAAGYILKGMREWSLAISSFSRALKGEPEGDSELYEVMAECYLQLEQWDSMVSVCTQGLEQEPQNTELIYLRGQAHYRLHNYGAAMRDVQRFNSFFPERPSNHYNLGVIYQGMGEEERALKEFDRALSLDLSYAPSYYHKAEIYYHQMQMDLCVTQLVQWGLFMGEGQELTLEERTEQIEQLAGFNSDILSRAAAELSEFYGNRSLLS